MFKGRLWGETEAGNQLGTYPRFSGKSLSLWQGGEEGEDYTRVLASQAPDSLRTKSRIFTWEKDLIFWSEAVEDS